MRALIINLIVVLGIIYVHTRCLKSRQCVCTGNTIRCIRLNDIPPVPGEFADKIAILDLKKCRLTRLSQLNKIRSWPALKIVDVRDQLGYFVCDVEPAFHFEILSDCLKLTTVIEMTSQDENDTYFGFETTQTASYEYILLSSKRDVSTVVLTTIKKPPRRIFPKRNSTTIGKSPSHITSTLRSVTKDVTLTANAIKTTPQMDNNTVNKGKLHVIFVIFTVMFTVILVSSLVLIMLHIYGGLCTCVKRVRAIICMCVRCSKNNKDNDKDTDQGDRFSLTSTTLFDVTEMSDITIFNISKTRPGWHLKCISN